MSTPFGPPARLGAYVPARTTPRPQPMVLGPRLGALGVAAQPTPPDQTTQLVMAGANAFRVVGADLAKLWNWLVTPSGQPTTVDTPGAVPDPAIGTGTSAIGVGESAYSIATAGPSPQNVGGLGLGVANVYKNITQWLGLGEDAASGAGAGASASSIIGPATSVIGTGLTAYSVAEHPTPGGEIGLATSASYAAGYAATAAGLEGVAGAASILGPMGLVLSLPFIVGGIFHTIARATGLTHAAFHFPGGYQPVDVPGYDAAAVDPATGRLLLYHDGHYTWSDQTLAGHPVTPQQLTAWGVQPTGKLAQVPGYDVVPKVRDEWVAATLAGTDPTLLPAAGGTPASLTQSYLMDQRQPIIDQIAADNPGASQGEIWKQYTLTPEYQQEQVLAAALNPGPIEHGGGGN